MRHAVRPLALALCALFVLSSGSVFGSDAPDEDAAALPPPVGPFCFHVAHVSPPKSIMDIKLFAQQAGTDTLPLPVFVLTGTELRQGGFLNFVSGWGFQGTDFSFFLMALFLGLDFRATAHSLMGSLNVQTFAGSGRCFEPETDSTCGRGVAVSYTPFPCP